MVNFQRPFGYVRDNYGNGHIFQHAPFSEIEMLTCSTMPVYSGAQMQEAVQASRKQAQEEIAPYLQRIKDHAEFDDSHLNTKVGQLFSILDEVAAIRSLVGHAPSIEPEFRAAMLELAREEREGNATKETT